MKRLSKIIAAAAVLTVAVVVGSGANPAQAYVPLDDEIPVMKPMSINDPDGDGYGVGTAKIGRVETVAANGFSTCNQDPMFFDVVVTQKGKDRLGLKLIDDQGNLVDELLGLPAPSLCSGYGGPDGNNPDAYTAVQMTSNGLLGWSGAYEVYIVRDGQRNKPHNGQNSGQQVAPNSGYVTGNVVTNPVTFTTPNIDLSQDDGIIPISWTRQDVGSPMGDCDTPIKSSAFLSTGQSAPASLIGARLVIPSNLASTDVNGYGYPTFRCQTGGLRLAATMAGVLDKGLRLEGIQVQPSGVNKVVYREYVDITATGTLVKTPPEVTFNGLTDGAEYVLGEVPALDYDCTDAPASIATGPTGCEYLGGYSTDLGTHTVQVSSKSWGGDTVGSVTYTVTDTPPDLTPPAVAIDGIVDGDVFAFGSVPAVDCSATDDVDGAVPCTVDGYSTDLGTHTVTATASDSAGNTGTATVTYTVEDQTPPVVTISGVENGAIYEFGNVPTAVCAATDDVDAVVECVIVGDSVEVGDHAVVASATDSAGNTGTASVTYTVIDVTAPSIAILSPADGGLYADDAVPAPDFGCADDESTVTVCEQTGWSDAVGVHTMTVRATSAGGTATQSVTYEVEPAVIPSDFGPGFAAPLDPGVVNTGKANRAFPIKFNVFQGGVEVTDPAAVTLTVSSIACGMEDVIGSDSIEETFLNELDLKWTGDEFLAKLQVGKGGAGCYSVVASMIDGSGSTGAYFEVT